MHHVPNIRNQAGLVGIPRKAIQSEKGEICHIFENCKFQTRNGLLIFGEWTELQV